MLFFRSNTPVETLSPPFVYKYIVPLALTIVDVGQKTRPWRGFKNPHLQMEKWDFLYH